MGLTNLELTDVSQCLPQECTVTEMFTTKISARIRIPARSFATHVVNQYTPGRRSRLSPILTSPRVPPPKELNTYGIQCPKIHILRRYSVCFMSSVRIQQVPATEKSNQEAARQYTTRTAAANATSD